MDAVRADNEEVAGSARTKLMEHADEIANMQKVVRVRTDAKVTRKLIPYANVKDAEVLSDLATEWGITRQVNALLKALNLAQLDSVNS